MPKYRYWIFLFALLLIEISSANLIINPTNVNISATVGETKSFTLNFTNTFNFSIQDFQFSDMSGLVFTPFTLQPNQSKVATFNFTRANPITSIIPSKVSFKYLVPVPQTPITHQVNITDSGGFQPRDITIHQDDMIIWRNNGTITHTVTTSNFELNIPAGSTSQRTFSNIEFINYYDTIVFFTGTINILNRS